jgi:hypothetical protein
MPRERRSKFGNDAVDNASLASSLAQNAKEVSKRFTIPYFIEYFGSFNRFGIGLPSGIANYTGGNYVLFVSGNVGDSFVTVQTGNIADAGASAKWACVIENNDGLFDVNQVTGTDGVSRINLLEPLKKSITNKRLGNLHDSTNGQHYTELGYFAFAQHFYKSNPRYIERQEFIAQFKPDDTVGKWVCNAFNAYNQASNMVDTNKYLTKVGSKHYYMSANDNADYVEWEQTLSKEKGYLETYVGTSHGTALVEFFLDGVLVGQQTIGEVVQRIIYPYERAEKGKLKVTAQGLNGDFSTQQSVFFGLTTWWKNQKFQEEKLLSLNDKIVYIGDSWGEFHNKATTRELLRLMTTEGGTPTILNYSKGGHTSTYARTWFEQYVIDNAPDKVIIEYFTNDFNSIGGVNVGTFTNPDGQAQDMNIASINHYLDNMEYMINRAIEVGIQPIIILPASTNSESQLQSFADKFMTVFLGKNITVENPTFKNTTMEKALTNVIETYGADGVGKNTLKLLSKEVNSGTRKGVFSDTDRAITGGDIHGFYNNGVRKAGVKHDGSVEQTSAKLIPQSSTFGNNANTRGGIYLLNTSGTGNVDELRVVIQLADGSFAQKKIQLVD